MIKKVRASSGGASGNSFETIQTTSGTSPVADSSSDTLTLTAGTGITITGDSSTDTITIAATGDVAGPSSSTNTAIPVFDGTTGKILKQANSSVVINTAGTISAWNFVSLNSVALDGGRVGATNGAYFSYFASSAGMLLTSWSSAVQSGGFFRIANNNASNAALVFKQIAAQTGAMIEFRPSGSETPMSGVYSNGVPYFPTFTVATLPSAATYTRGIIFVSDESGGATMAFSDGTDWRRMADRAVVS